MSARPDLPLRLRQFADAMPDNAGIGPVTAESVVKPLLQEAAAALEAGGGWRCFHCGELFTVRVDAAAHFGWSEFGEAACRLNECEGGIVALLRKADAELSAYRADDTKLLREVYGLGSKHETEKRTWGDAEYARGLAAGRALAAGEAP